MTVNGDPCIQTWRSRLGVSFGRAYPTFRRFYREVLAKEFPGFEPGGLVEWQANAKGRDRYRILRLAQQWINSQRLRVGTKNLKLSWIRSFFLHNQAELPSDKSFHFSSDIPAVEGQLSAEAFKRIVLNSNKMYRAVFLMMSQGLMGEGELVYVNTIHYRYVLEKLTGNAGIFQLSLPGRKRNRNVKNFYTLLSTKSDWGDAMWDYLKSLSQLPKNALFRNDRGNALKTWNIKSYFNQRAVETGVIKQYTVPCRRCGGETVKGRRDDRKTVYTCKECGNADLASEVMNPNLSGGVRYGVNPHEIRDLMRSRWQVSGADPLVAEFMMQHDIDPNNYNKFMKYERQYPLGEYRKALPWLNVVSQDPDKVDRSDVQTQLEASEAKVEVLSREIARLRRDQQDVMRLKEHLPLLLELVEQAKNKER